jgi:hypothetical protein
MTPPEAQLALILATIHNFGLQLLRAGFAVGGIGLFASAAYFGRYRRFGRQTSQIPMDDLMKPGEPFSRSSQIRTSAQHDLPLAMVCLVVGGIGLVAGHVGLSLYL